MTHDALIAALVSALLDRAPQSIRALATKLHVRRSRLADILRELEVAGIVEQVPGARGRLEWVLVERSHGSHDGTTCNSVAERSGGASLKEMLRDPDPPLDNAATRAVLLAESEARLRALGASPEQIREMLDVVAADFDREVRRVEVALWSAVAAGLDLDAVPEGATIERVAELAIAANTDRWHATRGAPLPLPIPATTGKS